MAKLISRIGLVYFVVGFLVGCVWYIIMDTMLVSHRSLGVQSRHAAPSNEDYPDMMVDEDGFIDGETVQNDRIYHKGNIKTSSGVSCLYHFTFTTVLLQHVFVHRKIR